METITLQVGGATFQTFNSALDATMIHLQEQQARRFGCLELYQKTQMLPCFAKAQSVWLQSMRENFCGRHLKGLSGPFTKDSLWEFFLFLLRADSPEETLKGWADAITLAAREGNASFFCRLGKALENGRRKPIKHSLAFDILNHWMFGMLWLMSYERGAAALQAYTGRSSVSEEHFIRECKRQNLMRYTHFEMPLLITGYSPSTKMFSLSEEGEDKLGLQMPK